MTRWLEPAVLMLLALIAVAAGGDEITIMVAGDALIVEAPPPQCRDALDTVLGEIRRADVATANLETSLVGDDSVPAATSGGLWLRADPGVAEWLQASGLDVVSQANNHAGDWGWAGTADTQARLLDVGIETAGFGRDESSAWKPAFTELCGSTVAVVAAACLPRRDPMRARDAEPGFAARSGIASIGTRAILEMSPSRFATFSSVLRETGIPVAISSESINLGDTIVRQSRRPSFVVDLDEGDLERLRRAVAMAATEADIVLVSLHCAEGETLGSAPPRDLRSAVAGLAELGADALFVHGPHRLRGAEWAGPGTVALYGLGSLVLQHRRVTSQPREAFRRWEVEPTGGTEALLDRVERAMGPTEELWDGLAATLVFDGGRLDRVELIPLDLAGSGPDDPCRGLPVVAIGQRRDEILGRISTRSRGLRGHVVPSGRGAVLVATADRGAVDE